MADRLPVPYDDRNLTVGYGAPHRDESSLRALICHTAQKVYRERFAVGLSGSISARLDTARILITPPGVAFDYVQPDQVLLLSVDSLNQEIAPAHLLRGAAHHLEVYRQRPDAGGVIFAQPPTALALSIAGISMRTCVVPEAVIVLGLVPTAAYHPPGSPEARESVRALAPIHDAILFAHDGALTIGQDPLQALFKLELLEHTAGVLQRTALLAPIPTLPPDQVSALLTLRRQLGYWRPGDETRFCEMCGVC